MEHSALIIALGGPSALASRLGVARTTPAKWGHRGIPPIYWPRLVREGRHAGLNFTVEDLEKAAPLRRCSNAASRRMHEA